MTICSESFRDFFGAFPTAVSIVTTLDARGEPRGLTCNSVAAVSLDPPLLSICVANRSKTLEAFTSTGSFVVNVLAEGGEELSTAFAGNSRDKFAGVEWVPSAITGGVPVLATGTLAYAECSVVQSVRAGDHRILIGRIDGSAVFPSRPLLYQRSTYSVWRPAPPVSAGQD
ncbi:flavin reductase family protein [Amycolatopsis sp. TRM77291]|uniref:flavin reductase family protein n=1 Tax=Amycolatopsis sp. WAC 04197 TaxID=2203199 RepID=UPI000F78F6AD|nr:flavin reductase family protein [Amycolatopsis sp. WAC 04197]RSN39080.1 flavin reductase [Amycolatopsis sp. WAC 04197]